MEVKPFVGCELQVVSGQHLCQIMVQAFYAMVTYGEESILVSLTDAAAWHFCHISLVKSTSASRITPLVNVDWVKSFSCTFHDYKEVVSFIASYLAHGTQD